MLSGSAPTWTLTTVVNPAWLTAPERVFPVCVDPTTTFGTSADLGCWVTNPAPGTPPDPKGCAANTGTDLPVKYGYTAFVRRTYIKFGDLTAAGSPVPLDAVISDAELKLTQEETSNPTLAMDTSIAQAAGAWTRRSPGRISPDRPPNWSTG